MRLARRGQKTQSTGRVVSSGQRHCQPREEALPSFLQSQNLPLRQITKGLPGRMGMEILCSLIPERIEKPQNKCFSHSDALSIASTLLESTRICRLNYS